LSLEIQTTKRRKLNATEQVVATPTLLVPVKRETVSLSTRGTCQFTIVFEGHEYLVKFSQKTDDGDVLKAIYKICGVSVDVANKENTHEESPQLYIEPDKYLPDIDITSNPLDRSLSQIIQLTKAKLACTGLKIPLAKPKSEIKKGMH
jgi:hypothetical protein